MASLSQKEPVVPDPGNSTRDDTLFNDDSYNKNYRSSVPSNDFL